MNLAIAIAVTHIRTRIRQTALAIIGVATGVGFSVAMAALMQGSQQDFIDRIVDASPHVVIRDDFRLPELQPAERLYADGAVALQGQKPKSELRGIRNPQPKLATLDALPDASAAPTLRGQVVMRYGGKDVAVSLVGIDPKRERQVSNLARDMRVGTLNDLYTAANSVILGDGLAQKLAAERGSTLTLTSPAGVVIKAKVVGLFHSGMVSLDVGTAYALIKDVQVLMERPNVINEIRLKLDDPVRAREVAARLEARFGYRTEFLAGGERVADAGVPDPQHHHVHGGGGDPGGRRLRHLQHRADHRLREDPRHRHPEVDRLPRGRDSRHLRPGGAGDRRLRHGGGMGDRLRLVPPARVDRIAIPRRYRHHPPADRLRLAPLCDCRDGGDGVGGDRRLPAGAAGGAARSGGDHPRGDVSTTTMLPAPLVAEDVSRVLPGPVPTTLVRHISLALAAGQFIAIVGPSGSGKSSLLYLLGLLDRPSEGRVLLEGEDASRLGREALPRLRLARIGFVFQFHFLLPEFTAVENVLLPMRRLGGLTLPRMRARADALLERLGLADKRDRRPDQLSGGERQRVAIARALANDPMIVLADEPTGNLDTTNADQVFRILAGLARDDGRTVVAVTHNLDLAARADRTIEMRDGRIVGDHRLREVS